MQATQSAKRPGLKEIEQAIKCCSDRKRIRKLNLLWWKVKFKEDVVSLAMAQATARGDMRALATYIRTCERSGGLSVDDMRRVCDHIIAADEYSLEVEAKSEPGLFPNDPNVGIA